MQYKYEVFDIKPAALTILPIMRFAPPPEPEPISTSSPLLFKVYNLSSDLKYNLLLFDTGFTEGVVY